MESNNINKMAIKQKLIIDKSKTSNLQIIIRDETGIYSLTNPTGYGGINGIDPSKIEKYIIDIQDLITGNNYRQINSDDITNPDEVYNPSIVRIINKEDITLDANNFDLFKFPDSLYKINMNILINEIYDGDGFQGTESLVNVAGAATLYRMYKGIYVDDQIYLFRDLQDSVISLDRTIQSNFNQFKPILRTSKELLLSDDLNDCLDRKIAQMADNCDCDNSKTVNSLAELQVIIWGMYRAADKEDYMQVLEYFNLAKNLCKSLNCNC